MSIRSLAVRLSTLGLALLTTNCGFFGTTPVTAKEGLATLQSDINGTEPIKLSDLHPTMVKAWRDQHGVAGLYTEAKANEALEIQDATVWTKDAIELYKKEHKTHPPLPDFSPRKRLFDQIRIAQCISKSSNPFIAVYTGAFSLALQGSLTETTTAGLGSVPAWGPTASQALAVSKQQAVTLPITFVPAVNLANFYFGQMMAYFPNLTSLLAWPSPDPVSAWPQLPSWPDPVRAPAPGTPAQTNPATIALPTFPPAPESQLAKVQVVLDQILQMRSNIDKVATRAVSTKIPTDQECTDLKSRRWAAGDTVVAAAAFQ